MQFPEHLAPDFMHIVRQVIDANEPDQAKLKALWGTLATLQGVLIAHVLAGRIGTTVFAGPFRGMNLAKEIMNRPFAPELLGTKQWEIHDKIEELIARAYKHIVIIGCDFGYSAVGYALRVPEAVIHACETEAAARDLCRDMAEANDVKERVLIAEKPNTDKLEAFSTDKTLLVIEDENQAAPLLNPQQMPFVTKMDMLVKLRLQESGAMPDDIAARFAPTHDVRFIATAPFTFPLDKILGPDYPLEHFDSLIATWEPRDAPVCYAVFTRKRFVRHENG